MVHQIEHRCTIELSVQLGVNVVACTEYREYMKHALIRPGRPFLWRLTLITLIYHPTMFRAMVVHNSKNALLKNHDLITEKQLPPLVVLTALHVFSAHRPPVVPALLSHFPLDRAAAAPPYSHPDHRPPAAPPEPQSSDVHLLPHFHDPRPSSQPSQPSAPPSFPPSATQIVVDTWDTTPSSSPAAPT